MYFLEKSVKFTELCAPPDDVMEAILVISAMVDDGKKQYHVTILVYLISIYFCLMSPFKAPI